MSKTLAFIPSYWSGDQNKLDRAAGLERMDSLMRGLTVRSVAWTPKSFGMGQGLCISFDDGSMLAVGVEDEYTTEYVLERP